MEIKPNFSQGDVIAFDMGNGVTGSGIICGKAIEGILDFWIVEVKTSNFDNKTYPYKCISIAHPMISFIESGKDAFEKVLKEVRDFYKISAVYCTGSCTVLKQEGPRHYSESAPLKSGKCTQCKKVRYDREKHACP
jgi:hypothetical protein